MKCAIFAIARKENLYIRDWVTYHLSIGFDKIYIFDNNFDGEENFNDVISDFIEKDIVNIINVRNKKCYQNVSYNYAILNLCSKYDWNAFIDIDEFITLKKFKDINETTMFNDKFIDIWKNEEYLISHSQYMLIGRIEKINVGNNQLNS